MFEITSALGRVLDALSVRQSVLSDNIANVNTPGFKRSDVDFREVARQAFAELEKTSPIEDSELRRDLLGWFKIGQAPCVTTETTLISSERWSSWRKRLCVTIPSLNMYPADCGTFVR